MSMELFALSSGIPRDHLRAVDLGTVDAAREVLTVLTEKSVESSGLKKLDKLWQHREPRLAVGTFGDTVFVAASNLPGQSLSWEELRRQRPEAPNLFAVGAYPGSSGVEIVWSSAAQTLRHLSVTDGAVEVDEGNELPFEAECAALTPSGWDALFSAAPTGHRQVDEEGERLLLDPDDKLIGRVDEFVVDDDDLTWIPRPHNDAPDIDDGALADAAALSWFGFTFLHVPKKLKLYTFALAD